MGRPFKLTPHQKAEAIRRRDEGEETLAEIGRSYNISGEAGKGRFRKELSSLRTFIAVCP
jgi:hypothetical protein